MSLCVSCYYRNINICSAAALHLTFSEQICCGVRKSSFSVSGICVAGYSTERNEILELLLPLKLYAKGNQVSQ